MMNGHSKAASFICASCSRALRSSQSSRYPSRPLSAAFTSAARSDAPRSIHHRSLPTYNTRPRIPAEHGAHSRRYYATEVTSSTQSPSSPTSATQSPPETVASEGIAHLPHRRLLSLTGPDTAKFLQGLLTNNVDPNRYNPFYSAFLDARGRVLWDVFIWPIPPTEEGAQEWGCLIDVDANEIASLTRHLKKHKLRSKIKIQPVPEEEWSLWCAWPPITTTTLPSPTISLPDPRASKFGTRILSPTSSTTPPIPSLPVVDENQYNLRRHLYGVPESQYEIPRESALPMEYNIDLSHGIDFKKGCYVGQELTIRTKHTGVVRKRILPVVLYNSGQNLPQDLEDGDLRKLYDGNFTDAVGLGLEDGGKDIKALNEDGEIKKGRAAGKLISVVGNLGLALVRLEMMTSWRVSAEGGSWKPGMEFGVLGGGDEVVRVQAVVGDELRGREGVVWGKGRRGAATVDE